MKWLRRKPTIITAVSLVAVLSAAVALWNVSSSRTFQFFGELVDRVETTDKVVALTFDDGPDPAGAQADHPRAEGARLPVRHRLRAPRPGLTIRSGRPAPPAAGTRREPGPPPR